MLSSKMDNMVCISFKIKNIYTLPKFIFDKLDTLDINKANYIIDYQNKIKIMHHEEIKIMHHQEMKILILLMIMIL